MLNANNTVFGLPGSGPDTRQLVIVTCIILQHLVVVRTPYVPIGTRYE
jgi:hypothetical protein